MLRRSLTARQSAPRKNLNRRPHLEPLEDRTVPSTIQGVVFEDLDGDGVRQAGEPGLQGWTLFLDANLNSVLDAGETSTLTDENGAYSLEGSGVVARVLEVDDPLRNAGRWVPTTPASLGSAVGPIRDFGAQYHEFGAYVPQGGETLVNLTTAGVQGSTSGITGAIAADAQGNFAVVWRSGDQVLARLFAADGTPTSGEILVATSATGGSTGSPTPDTGHVPLVAMADNGQFAVAWHTFNASTGTNAVFSRAFAATGSPLGAAVQITSTSNSLTNQATGIAMDANGDYVVIYHGAKKSGFSWNGGLIGFQRFNAQGQTAGKATQVIDASLVNGMASAGMDASGNFVVVWDDGGVRAQRYDAAGKKVGGQIAVGAGVWSSVAMNGAGQFAVAFENASNLNVRVYSAAGAPVSGPVVFGSSEFTSPSPGIAIDDAGNVVLTWTSYGQRQAAEVHVRRLLADGTLETDYVVNTTTSGVQARPSVAITGTDSFVVSWSGAGAGDDAGVFFQRYGAAGGGSLTATTSSIDAALASIDLDSASDELDKSKARRR
jgi:hypothetical protein